MMSKSYKPDPAAAEIRRIGSLIDGHDLAKAEAGALKLLKAQPRRPDVHNIMGVVYVRQGKKNRAVPHFEFAVKADPENAHYLNNLGRLYVDLTLVELALPFLHKALAIAPNLVAALLAMGRYYRDVGKADLALPYFKRLRKIAPQDNEVKLAFAECLDTLGKDEDAGALYRELYRTKSYLTASLNYFSRHDPPDATAPLIAEIEGLLSSGTLPDHERSKLHTALGFIYERMEDPLAFAHFDKANRLRPLAFDILEYRRWVDGIIEVFTKDFFAERAGFGNPSMLPVLVVGMPRSGTTLVEQMIASHSQAAGAGELARIDLFARRLACSPQASMRKFVAAIDAYGRKGLREMADNYVDLLKFHAPKAARVVDKMPHNFQYLGFIALLCPNARIIHCARNPMDTCWSCFQNPLRDAHAYSRDLTHLGLYYREYRRLMDHWRTVLPLQIHEAQYEKLTDNFEGEARGIIDSIGLPWDDACLNFHEGGRTIRTFSRQQVRSPVHKKSVERWRRYERELEPLLNALGDLA